MRCPTKTPCPEPEGKVRRSGQPPVEAIAVVAERPSGPATRHDAIADAEAPHAPAARHDGPKHPGHLMGVPGAAAAARSSRRTTPRRACRRSSLRNARRRRICAQRRGQRSTHAALPACPSSSPRSRVPGCIDMQKRVGYLPKYPNRCD